MLPVILLVLVVLVAVPFGIHALRHGKVESKLPKWLVELIKGVDPNRPAGAVVVLQEELHRQIERDQIITLGRSKIAPAGAAVRCHPDDATKAEAILPQIKTEAVNHARSRGLAISESFEVRIYPDPTRQPRRPKVDCWIDGQTPPKPPTTPQTTTAAGTATADQPTAPATEQATTTPATDQPTTPTTEQATTAPATTDHHAAGQDLPTQLLAQGDIPTDHQPLAGMLRLIDRHGRALPIKAGAKGQIIGRAETADIRLNHRTISRKHALLLRDGDGFTIEAHESCTNGVWVDSHPAIAGDPIHLTEGATIVLAPDVIYTATYTTAA